MVKEVSKTKSGKSELNRSFTAKSSMSRKSSVSRYAPSQKSTSHGVKPKPLPILKQEGLNWDERQERTLDEEEYNARVKFED